MVGRILELDVPSGPRSGSVPADEMHVRLGLHDRGERVGIGAHERRAAKPRGRVSSEEMRLRLDLRPDRTRERDVGRLPLTQQELELRRGLHALRHDLQVQAVTERNDGPHDRRIVGIVTDVGDEGAVDLERVEGKSLQIVQRAIPGAEVIDRQREAEFLQCQ